MQEVVVKVVFSGDVKVLVPDHLDVQMAVLLATQLAIAGSVASVDLNSQVCEDACDEYVALGGDAADFEASRCESIGGQWNLKGVSLDLPAAGED